MPGEVAVEREEPEVVAAAGDVAVHDPFRGIDEAGGDGVFRGVGGQFPAEVREDDGGARRDGLAGGEPGAGVADEGGLLAEEEGGVEDRSSASSSSSRKSSVFRKSL